MSPGREVAVIGQGTVRGSGICRVCAGSSPSSIALPPCYCLWIINSRPLCLQGWWPWGTTGGYRCLQRQVSLEPRLMYPALYPLPTSPCFKHAAPWTELQSVVPNSRSPSYGTVASPLGATSLMPGQKEVPLTLTLLEKIQPSESQAEWHTPVFTALRR